MRPTILFDVNETLLNLDPLRSEFDRLFGGALNPKDWFRELLRLSFVSSTIDVYVPFTELGRHALATIAAANDVSLTEADVATIGGILATLPAHADSRPGLEALTGAGFRIAALTNSPQETAENQLAHAGLADLFERIMSVEMVQRLKPHRTVYQAAVSAMDSAPHECVMVAAHDWDIAGAMRTGLVGLFVSRPGQEWSPAFGAPDHRSDDITSAAGWLIRSTTV